MGYYGRYLIIYNAIFIKEVGRKLKSYLKNFGGVRFFKFLNKRYGVVS